MSSETFVDKLTDGEVFLMNRSREVTYESVTPDRSTLDISAGWTLNLSKIPSWITRLGLHNCPKLDSFEGVNSGIARVSAIGCMNLRSLAGLPSTVEDVNIDMSSPLRNVGGRDRIPTYPRFPGEELSEPATFPDGLAPLPPSVKKLTLTSVVLESFEGLPTGLESLVVQNMKPTPSLSPIPDGIKSLKLENCSGVEALPYRTELEELDLFCSGTPSVETPDGKGIIPNSRVSSIEDYLRVLREYQA